VAAAVPQKEAALKRDSLELFGSLEKTSRIAEA